MTRAPAKLVILLGSTVATIAGWGMLAVGAPAPSPPQAAPVASSAAAVVPVAPPPQASPSPAAPPTTGVTQPPSVAQPQPRAQQPRAIARSRSSR